MINLVTSSRYRVNRKHLVNHAKSYVASYDDDPDISLNIVFVGKRKMRDIAKKYKHEDVALPVLSFIYNQKLENNEKLLGEIFICYPQAILLAAERGKKVDNIMMFLLEHAINNLYK